MKDEPQKDSTVPPKSDTLQGEEEARVKVQREIARLRRIVNESLDKIQELTKDEKAA